MDICTRSPAYIRAISAYVPGKPISELAREMNLPEERIVKLASNENPLGMSPKARSAVEKALSGIHRYPDNFELTRALAAHLCVAADQVALGNGSNDVLDLVARCFLTPGSSSVFSQHAFAVYPLASVGCGAQCVSVPAKNYAHDLPALVKAVRPDTRILWIANPNNPTGSFIPPAELRRFVGEVPRDVIVVLDEAYNEYLTPENRSDSIAWLREFPNLVVTRTFSKIYGLAGLRVGYAVAAPGIIDLMNRVRQPFNVNNLALAAALAALDDTGFLQQSYELNQRGMAQITEGLKKLQLQHLPAHGNFVTFAVNNAAAVNQKLLQQGVIIRPLAGYAMPEHLRVTIGLEDENARFLAALERAL